MVHPGSHEVSRVPWYSGSVRELQLSYTGLLPSMADLSRSVLLTFRPRDGLSATPYLKGMVWALPISLAATLGIDVSFSSSGYLDVSVHRVPSITLCIHVNVTRLLVPGFPIRTSMDQSLLTAPHGFSQLTASFFGSWCQGIHPVLLLA